MDILSLEELSTVLSRIFFNKYKIHLHKYITASQIAYDVWKNSNKEEKFNIHINTDLDDYDFIRKSIYGGRTYPMMKHFKSKRMTGGVPSGGVMSGGVSSGGRLNKYIR